MIILRDYQEAAVAAVKREFDSGRKSTALILPTGCGKTVAFCAYSVRHMPHRTLILAHRGELVRQAVRTLGRFGESCDIEMANCGTSDRNGLFGSARFVAGTVQSVCRPSRLRRLDPAEFGQVIIDECHHSVRANAMYRRILDHFKGVRLLGVTATPDRSDGFALGEVFESEAYRLPLDTAFDLGWLVPLEQQFIRCEGLDLASIRVVKGEIDQRELEAMLLESGELARTAAEIAARCGQEPTLVFCPGVPSAHMIARLLNTLGVKSRTIDGTTPDEVREETLSAFGTEFSCLVGCDVFTEGFDSPIIRNVVVARLTKSRSRYVQMVGRGLRPLDGLLTGLETADPQERVARIAASAKPSCRVFDLLGSSMDHSLVTSVSIFDGKMSESVRKRALVLTAAGKKPREAVSQAQEEERVRLEMKTRSRAVSVSIYGRAEQAVSRPAAARGKGQSGPPVTEKQEKFLRQHGYNPAAYNRDSAGNLIGQIRKNRNNAPATDKQVRALVRCGESPDRTRLQASFLLDFAAARLWKRRDFPLVQSVFRIGQVPDPSGRVRFHPVIIDPIRNTRWCADKVSFDSVDGCRDFLETLLERTGPVSVQEASA
jgi:superfamily II DNA or RNA helicase